MSKNYRPVIEAPLLMRIESRHFSSGINTPGDARGLIGNVGITATDARPLMLAELELRAGGLTELFVDSGAFGEVAWSDEEKRLVVVRPIADADWAAKFELYAWAGRTFGRRARVVAPDLVGDQAATLARLERFAPEMGAVAATGATVIVPVQKGALPMSAMYARACATLGLRVAPVAGVPMKKDATSLEDLRELVASLPWYGARVHLLGLGPESKKYAPAVAAILELRPNCEITSDSVTIRRLVGRTNGRGNGPRALTRHQDAARAMGITGSTEVKAAGLLAYALDERDRELDRLHASGWFDVELHDTLEEAVAETAALRAGRAS